MEVKGAAAAKYDAVRLSSMETVNAGVLLVADEQSGIVQWTDRANELRTVNLGPHAIKIIRRR